jgi:hypothetical protein
MWIVRGPCGGAALRGNLDNEVDCNLNVNLPGGGNLNLQVGASDRSSWPRPQDPRCR